MRPGGPPNINHDSLILSLFLHTKECVLGLVWVWQEWSCSDQRTKNITKVFPSGGFRGRWVCTGVDSSKISLPFHPGEFVLLGMFWGYSVSPKILDSILLVLFEGTAFSRLSKRLLDSPPEGFMALEPSQLASPSMLWNMLSSLNSLRLYPLILSPWEPGH